MPRCCSTCRSACMTTSWPTRGPQRRRSTFWSRIGKRCSRTKARSSLTRCRSPGSGRETATAIVSRAVNDRSQMSTLAERAVARTPRRLALRFGAMSDTAIAWLFITPSVLLLLAINIFPLLWTIQLSFTNYRANRPNAVLRYVGLDNYRDILTDPEVWHAMQTTAHFVLWSIALELVLGFGLALLINRRFRGHSFWTTVILLPMMLSPAVVGNFWTFLLQPQIGLFNSGIALVTGVDPSSFQMIGDVRLAPWAIIMVDTWMWTPYVMLICLAGLRSIPDYIYEAAEVDRASALHRPWPSFSSSPCLAPPTSTSRPSTG